ncbi:MAG: sialate O-acetylesterase [Bacteroidota bacterium]|nr:sialate O-acetylesterase [Bacteroidota bacterium]
MVLQHDAPVIWGKADPGEKIKISVGEKSVRITAGTDGKWRVKLPVLKTGELVEVVVKGKNKILIKNVLIGDVWIGAGQSNMVWPLKSMENADAEMAAANFPKIRLFTVKNVGSAYTPQDDLKGQWVECSPQTVSDFSAALYFFGINLYNKLKCPLGLIVDAWSGSRIQSWMPLDVLRTDPQTRQESDDRLETLDNPENLRKYNERQLADWQSKCAEAKEKDIAAPGKPAPTTPLYRDRPGGLYNSMIAPLVGLGMKGVLWYQGEFNASDADQYARLLPMMINDWRQEWESGDFPFIVVQLHNVNQPSTYPTESLWARLREAQLKALDLKNTAVTITIDTGDGELHPKTKRKLGERAAASALKLAYGMDIPADAPLYDGYKIEENKIRIFFKNTAGGLESKDGKPIVGFTIAGSNYKFVNAQAVIDGNSVVVWNNQISVPVAVRYAWAQFPIVTLYNKAGLPASSFRTDHWPMNVKNFNGDTIKKSVIKKLLHPDYTSSPMKDVEKIYTSFEFKVSEKDEQVLPYRFHQPKVEPGKKYPLVLLMHGAGERGFDNRLQLLRLKSLPFWEKNPCFVIAPQCPQKPADGTDGESVWVLTSFGAPSHSMKDKPTWPMQMTMDLLNKIIAEYPVDPTRVYVTGLSMGGFATWELIQRMPDKFAAAIPVCGGGDTALAKKLVNIPLWIFHGDEDKTVMTQRSRDMVKCITNAGGHPKYTEYPGVGHDAWGRTYNNPDVWDWLFTQKKKDVSRAPSVIKPIAHAQYTPQRKDDVAWENDRMAFRLYGPVLEKTEPTGSGIDVWVKSCDTSELTMGIGIAKLKGGQLYQNKKNRGDGLLATGESQTWNHWLCGTCFSEGYDWICRR